MSSSKDIEHAIFRAGWVEDALICDEGAQQVYGALVQLPEAQRKVIVLRAKDQMTFRQIAKIQNAPCVAVQACYRRGLNKLRKILDGRLL
jgi:RNA polymerase sigma factor (sigma-70 family)